MFTSPSAHSCDISGLEDTFVGIENHDEPQNYAFGPSICPSGRQFLVDGIPCMKLICNNQHEKGNEIPMSVVEHISQVQNRYVIERYRQGLQQRTDERGLEVVGNIPVLVIDCVVDYLEEEEMLRVDDWKHLFDKNRNTLWTDTLKALSLTHRSFTLSAQRALHASINLNDVAIDKFSLSPACGSWVKKLVMLTIDTDSAIFLRSAQRHYSILSSHILGRTVNLTTLLFQTAFLEEEQFVLFTKAISGLKNLEVLEVAEVRRCLPKEMDYDHLADFFVALSKLQKLKYLGLVARVHHETDYEKPTLRKDLVNLSPPSTLKAIYLENYFIDESYLNWLLEERDGYGLEDLIAAGSIGRPSVLKSALRPVRNLRLASFFGHEEEDDEQMYAEIFPACHSLRWFYMTSVEQLSTYTGALPPLLEVLEVERDTLLWNEDGTSSEMAAEIILPDIIRETVRAENQSLSSSTSNSKQEKSNLKQIVIHNGACLSNYKTLEEVCREHGIDFVINMRCKIHIVSLPPLALAVAE